MTPKTKTIIVHGVTLTIRKLSHRAAQALATTYKENPAEGSRFAFASVVLQPDGSRQFDEAAINGEIADMDADFVEGVVTQAVEFSGMGKKVDAKKPLSGSEPTAAG